jgi:hypothetical protein
MWKIAEDKKLLLCAGGVAELGSPTSPSAGSDPACDQLLYQTW